MKLRDFYEEVLSREVVPAMCDVAEGDYQRNRVAKILRAAPLTQPKEQWMFKPGVADKFLFRRLFGEHYKKSPEIHIDLSFEIPDLTPEIALAVMYSEFYPYYFNPEDER